MSKISPTRYFLVLLKVSWHLADPAQKEQFPDSARFRKVELIAEGGGKAEIVEIGHSQVVRIF